MPGKLVPLVQLPAEPPAAAAAPDLLLCRSLLTTCGLQPERYGKALEVGADVAILDLEDSVPPARRDEARRMVLSFLVGAGARHTGVIWAVRVNTLHSPDGLRDMLALVDSGAHPGILVLPKIESAAQVRIYEDLIAEALPDLAFLPVIETPRGLAAVEAIAAAGPRVRGLILGAADLSACLGSSLGWQPMLYARMRIAMAAAGAGIQAIDSPFFGLQDGRGLLHEIEQVREMGFLGKVAIHPQQIAPINEAFTPHPADVAHAREIVAASERSRGEICVVRGRMIGPPLVDGARQVLARARSCAARQVARGCA